MCASDAAIVSLVRVFVCTTEAREVHLDYESSSIHCVAMMILDTNITFKTTFNGGSLGSCIDEERGQPRNVV